MWKADFRDTNLQDVPQMSKKDRYTLDLMEGCVKFNDGHYVIPPLWRPDAPCLPQNRELALRRLTLLKRRLQRDDVFRKGYVNAVQSYIEKAIAGVAIGNPERHMRKASHCGSKQQ